jgi:uncharacterized protein Yka (UPF0111/DUF47 family)
MVDREAYRTLIRAEMESRGVATVDGFQRLMEASLEFLTELEAAEKLSMALEAREEAAADEVRRLEHNVDIWQRRAMSAEARAERYRALVRKAARILVAIHLNTGSTTAYSVAAELNHALGEEASS